MREMLQEHWPRLVIGAVLLVVFAAGILVFGRGGAGPRAAVGASAQPGAPTAAAPIERSIAVQPSRVHRID